MAALFLCIYFYNVAKKEARLPLIQRNSVTFSNLVYTTGNYYNPQWIRSLSPAKVGSGIAQWNASCIMGYPINTSGALSGQYLMFDGSGFVLNSVTGISGSGSSYYGNSGILLIGDTFVMGGTGTLNKLLFNNNIISIGTDASETGRLSDINIGYGAGFSFASGSIFSRKNISIGYLANSTSDGYTAGQVSLGEQAGRFMQSSTGCIAIGYLSYSYAKSGDHCIAIGRSAFASSFSSVESIGIGVGVGQNTSLEDSIIIGGSNLGDYTRGSKNILIGKQTGPGSTTSQWASNNIFIGFDTNNGFTGSGNLVIDPSGNAGPISGVSNVFHKIAIGRIIAGDMDQKRLAIGNVSSGNLSPNATLELVPKTSTDKVLITKAASSQTANLIEGQDSGGSPVFSVSPSGAISGALSPAVVQSTGMMLTDFHHGKIIEHTGVVSGTYTIGTITVPSWQCMLVNFGSGMIIGSGSNTIRSYSDLNKISDLYGSASTYRRPNGEFFLYGNLN